MSYVCIYSDDNVSDIKIKGTALDCYANLGAAVAEAMAQIIPKMPGNLSAQRYAKMFLETVEKQLRDHFGPLYAVEPVKKSETSKADQPQDAAPKRPTPEEVLEMVMQLDDAGLRKLSGMVTHDAVKRMQAEQEPKNDGKKAPAVGYAVFM